MSDEQIRRIVADSYDDAREELLRTMGRDFFSRKFLLTNIFMWVWALPLMALAIYSAAQFFQADQTRGQIMYAALFIVAVQGVWVMKIFAWQMLHQFGIRRDLKRMELRVAELSERVKGT